jgi:hypothetical protein
MESDSILGFDVSRSCDSWFIVLVQEQLGGFVTALPVDYHSKREVIQNGKLFLNKCKGGA